MQTSTPKSPLHITADRRDGLILKLFTTFIRVTTVGRTGVQVDATVSVHRDHRAEATVYGHHAAVTVAAPAAVVVMDHHDLSGVSCWKAEKQNCFSLRTFERAKSSL